MSLKLNLGQINHAAGGNNDLRETLTGIYQELRGLYRQTGAAPLEKVDRTPVSFLGAPPKCSFSVEGRDGYFRIAITLPQQASAGRAPKNVTNASLYQELSSSPVADFSSSVVTYPRSANTNYLLANPGATLYWRVRSSYDQKTWNSYQIYPGAVAAGKLSSSATEENLSLNQSNFATVDSIGSGSSATIRIYGPGGVGSSWSRVVGARSEVIPAGTILNVDYGATGYIAWDGMQYRLVPSLTQTFMDSWAPVGKVSVVANGSAVALPAFVAVVTSGAVVAIKIVSPGNGLTAPPTLTISDSAGTGATATCTVSAGQVSGVTVTNAGSGYSSNPTITASGGVSNGAGGGGGPAGSNGGRLYADV